MIRWRYLLTLSVVLLLLPSRTTCKSEDDEDDERSEETEEDDDDDDEDEEEETDKMSGNVVGGDGGMGAGAAGMGRRMPPPVIPSTNANPMGLAITRTTKKRPLECYVCAYKAETPLRACLDPTKFRVHTITCHSVDDKCFTSVISKGNTYEAVVRGCRSGCVGSAETTCCEVNRCNNQAFAMPLIQQRAVITSDKKNIIRQSAEGLHSNVLFFVTILLVLHTVVKVSFV